MIREYRRTDCEFLIAVWERASAVAHPFLDRNFMERERRDISEVYLPNAETWVWESHGAVVGFMSLLGNEVGALFVDPKFHRAGIGRAFIEHARQRHDVLEVEVFRRNHLGRAFYEKIGFEHMLQKVHEPTGFTLLRLRLSAR